MTLPDLVASMVQQNPRDWGGQPMSFDDLVTMVRGIDPEADVCAIDAAARRFERGAPGAFTYEPTETT